MTFKDILCRGIADPGAFVGFKGERSLTEWQADGVLELMRQEGLKVVGCEAITAPYPMGIESRPACNSDD